MAAQLKSVINAEIIQGAILPTVGEEEAAAAAAAEKCHLTYAANESTIKWLWRPTQPAVQPAK